MSKKSKMDAPSSNGTKRVVALADFHCGHRAGLTPPDWWQSVGRSDWGTIQRETWNEYSALAEEYHSPDLLIVNGDMIDGRGTISGGTELITTSLREQTEMAAECIRIWNAKRVICTIGTGYHVSFAGEDWEEQLEDLLGADVKSHPAILVDGVVFDVKHYSHGSSLPHLRSNGLGRDWLTTKMWAIRGERPDADIILRAHRHYFSFAGDDSWLGIIQPGLQAAATKFGARQCDGTVDWGIIVFEVADGILLSWFPRLVSLQANKTEAIVV